jgi:hypothetical protein
MQNLGSNVNMDNFVTLAIAITVIGLTLSLINSYIQYSNNVQGQIDSTRVHEGLPTDISLTPEDFINHPELVEIFGVQDQDNNLNLNLESNEHFEQQQNQPPAVDYTDLDTIYDIVENFISSFL